MLDALDALRATQRADHEASWRATAEVLGWLYRCEEAERQADPDYYADRDGNEDGRCLAGLIWFRTLTDHHQAEVQHISPGGVLRTKNGILRTGSGGVLRTASRRKDQWPDRAQLPERAQVADKHGRDIAYERLVQGEPLLRPLERACTWLLSR